MVSQKKILIPALTAKAEETKPKDSELAESQRNQMPWTANNTLAFVAALQENTGAAFDILVDMFGILPPDRFDLLAKSLDDMNMRGAQIVRAWEFSAKQSYMFEKLVRDRDTDMITFVNDRKEVGEVEMAVRAGEHKWMHLQPKAK